MTFDKNHNTHISNIICDPLEKLIHLITLELLRQMNNLIVCIVVLLLAFFVAIIGQKRILFSQRGGSSRYKKQQIIPSYNGFNALKITRSDYKV